jgi:hypothetical protein
MPFVNDMSKSLHFLIEGISVNLLLGPSDVENTLTLQHLGYLIFRTVKTLHSTFPPHLPFPPELSKLKTRFDIEGIISVKKVHFNKPLKPTPTSTPNHIRPLLGVIIEKDSSLSKLLLQAIQHVCITNSAKLPLYKRNDHLSIYLHALSPSADKKYALARQINTTHRTLHDTTKHTIICNIRISYKIITPTNQYLRRATASFGNCIGFLLDFTNGPVDLHLTGLFHASRDTNYLSPQHVTSRIIEFNQHDINLSPSPPSHPPPSPPSLQNTATPPFTPPHGRGRGRGQTTPTPPCHTRHDQSNTLYHITHMGPLSILPAASHKYYVIINGVGGIAIANIYSLNFDNGGLRSMITHVPFNMHQSFATHPEAWTFFTAFYPLIKSPDDVTYMNKNCPAKTSNLTNPSKHFRDVSGFSYTSSRGIREYERPKE